MPRQTIEVKCSVCEKAFQKELRRIKQAEKLGQKHTCSRKCSSEISNTKRISPPKTKNAKHTRKDKEKYPEKDRARYLVRQAIKQKKLIPPQTCEYCEEIKKTEAHHVDHGEPFLLVWLCKDDHAFFDKHKIFGFEKDYSEQVGHKKED
jgi:hypothetical protein